MPLLHLLKIICKQDKALRRTFDMADFNFNAWPLSLSEYSESEVTRGFIDRFVSTLWKGLNIVPVASAAPADSVWGVTESLLEELPDFLPEVLCLVRLWEDNDTPLSCVFIGDPPIIQYIYNLCQFHFESWYIVTQCKQLDSEEEMWFDCTNNLERTLS